MGLVQSIRYLISNIFKMKIITLLWLLLKNILKINKYLQIMEEEIIDI